MKMKKFGIGMIVFCLSFACVACGSKESSKEEPDVSSDYEEVMDSYDEILDYYEESFEDEEKVFEGDAKYDSDIMEKLDDLAELQGEVVDIRNLGSDLYVSTRNKVYQYTFGTFNEIIEVPKEIENIVVWGEDVFVLKYTDDSYGVCRKSYEDSLFKEVEGIDAENAIYVNDSYTENTLVLIKAYEDAYYVDKYEIDDNNIVISKELNIPVRICEDGGDYFENIKHIAYIEKGRTLYFTLTDGKVFSAGGWITIFYKDDYATVNVTQNELLNNAERIFEFGDIFTYSRPLYEQVGDEKNLCVYLYDEYETMVGNPAEQYKIIIPLPDGYVASDIKDITFDDALIIEFTDNNVYVSKEENISELQYNESLTTLCKEGQLKRIAFTALDMVALMDDNCIYELELF